MAEEIQTTQLSEEEQLAALNYGSDQAGDGELEGQETPEPGPDPAPETTPEPVEQEEPGSDPDEPAGTEEESPPEEKNWQSAYDAEKHRTSQLEAELESAKQQTAAVASMLQNLGVNQGGSAPVVPEPEKEPNLWDYISEDVYVPEDATHPGTASGAAYTKWQGELQAYRARAQMRQYEQDQAAKQKEAVGLKQAAKLAARVPKFRDPLTQGPNMAAVAKFIDDVSSSEDPELWADLYEFMENRNQKTRPAAPGPAAGTDQIGRKANQVRTAQGEAAVTDGPKPVPNSVKEYAKFFGGDFEVPIGVEIE